MEADTSKLNKTGATKKLNPKRSSKGKRTHVRRLKQEARKAAGITITHA
jgi:hypothetical protein